MEDEVLIRCTKCGKMRRRDEFYIRKSGSRVGELHRPCILCNLEYGKKYRQANPEKEKERCKKYRRANPEKVREFHKKYRQANSKKIREFHKKYYPANSKKIKERCRKWCQANPEKLKERRRKYHQANFKKINERSRIFRQSLDKSYVKGLLKNRFDFIKREEITPAMIEDYRALVLAKRELIENRRIVDGSNSKVDDSDDYRRSAKS